MSLPVELWREIFFHATHVRGVLATEWDYDPDDHVWCGWKPVEDTSIGTKRAIVQVCREWRAIGVEFLYEAIDIRAHTTAPYYLGLDRLVSIMRDSSVELDSEEGSEVGYGRWIKRVNITTDLLNVENDFGSLVSLLNLCYNLSILSIDGNDHPDRATFQLAEIVQTRFPHSLRRLSTKVHDTNAHRVFLPFIPLRTLDVKVDHQLSDLQGRFSFETITTLTIYFGGGAVLNSDSDSLYFPSLRTLSLKNIRLPDYTVLNHFVERHSETLRSLHLQPSLASMKMPVLISQATRLKSVSFDEADFMELCEGTPRDSIPTSFPGITHLGIVAYHRAHYLGKCLKGVGLILASKMFPNLTLARLLDLNEDIPFREEWAAVIEMCGNEGVRLLDGKGQELACIESSATAGEVDDAIIL